MRGIGDKLFVHLRPIPVYLEKENLADGTQSPITKLCKRYSHLDETREAVKRLGQSPRYAHHLNPATVLDKMDA